MSDVQIHGIKEREDLLRAVIALGDAFRDKLGMLTPKAYEERALAGEILVACAGDVLAGYLLYRVSGSPTCRATITHLCIAPDFRGQGLSRRLVDRLKQIAERLNGIRLSCRRDYPENTLWPALGFELLGEKPGRSTKGDPLNIWWFGHVPLLSRMERSIAEEQIVVALDANVVLDFGSDSPDSLESHPLLSEWIREHLYLCITRELNTEIDRQNNPSLRKVSREFAAQFQTLSRDEGLFDATYATLCRVVGDPQSESERSDRRHIAWAVTGCAEYFVTRDEQLLEARHAVQAELDIAIVRPAEIIVMIDTIARESDYQPRRFEGSRLSLSPASPSEESELVKSYLGFGTSEKRGQFLQALRTAFSRTMDSQVLEICDSARNRIVLIALTRSSSETTITLLRASNDRLAPTVLRQFLISALAKSQRRAVVVNDRHVSPTVQKALLDTHFTPTGEIWYKPRVDYVGPMAGLASHGLDDGQPGYQQLVQATAHAIERGNLSQRLHLERLWSPAKFTDLDLPCFIVPIKAHWAEQLFDTALASQTLFGLPPELGFRLENAYYRAAKPSVLEAPGRILWYVSKSSSYVGAGAIRAASYLDELVVDEPKALFSRFRRLGVYQWPHVYKTAKNDSRRQIMALRFSGTELFDSPVGWQELQALLESRLGHGNPLASPVQITPEVFFELYTQGKARPTS